ncbi:MAG: glycoside hydrolase family 3 C-terminal domain-containing protein [Candidatus Latescibacteria bacterium]|nr:glycoside hydrolase family 3 C-terminal domain-containing protein [Candidatus Latescibacterota bacterium]
MTKSSSLLSLLLFFEIVFCITISIAAQNTNNRPDYMKPDIPTKIRVEDLLSRMTLEEKIGQINMPCVYVSELGEDPANKMAACRKFTEGTYLNGIGPGGGFFTLPNSALHEGTRQQAEFINELQTIATKQTRLKIPVLITEEGTHGLMCSGGTIFPEGLALGSTWNMELLENIYATVAKEASAIGVHQLFTLVVEPYRDPRLGRNQEGYSEDPYICSRIAESIVRGIQGDDISAPDKLVAGLCHYPGQSQPVSGFERGAIEYSERVFREIFLPPWEAGVKKCGAYGVMATYPAIGGVPVHASTEILTTLLREELGFEGLVLGEGGGISTLVYEGLAPSQKEAGQLALKAGVDVGISYEDAYMLSMKESVLEGRVPVELLDRAVSRILTMKFRLGLFENPFVDPDQAVRTVHTSEHQELALQAAREGIVLLKNENNLLPLKKNLKSIAVIGPNADHVRNQLGDYTAWNILQDIVTVLDGIKNKVSPSTRIEYVKGCNVYNTDVNEIEKARKAAKKAEIAIVVVGENQWRVTDDQITAGEGYDVASLDLTGMQEELIRAVYETGTPTVVVLLNGRPLSIRWTAEHIPAIVEAWLCGEQGGNAVADVLFGDYNPSGRLSVTVPRHVGQLPVYYNAKKSKKYWIEEGWGKAYADMSPEPLYHFGHGLSYTTFEYTNLTITPSEIHTGGEVTISVDIANTGSHEGKEVVQLYLNDVIATVATPVMELKGFRKIQLKPGEKKTVEFTLNQEHLSLLNRHLERVVEPGTFEVKIGHSSKDIRLQGNFEVLND